ncbi:hypothetical protein [Bacillus atrophaeus]|nr:hypothetical protein [Bacillus atrophaeus]
MGHRQHIAVKAVVPLAGRYWMLEVMGSVLGLTVKRIVYRGGDFN